MDRPQLSDRSPLPGNPCLKFIITYIMRRYLSAPESSPLLSSVNAIERIASDKVSISGEVSNASRSRAAINSRSVCITIRSVFADNARSPIYRQLMIWFLFPVIARFSCLSGAARFPALRQVRRKSDPHADKLQKPEYSPGTASPKSASTFFRHQRRTAQYSVAAQSA